MLPVSCFYNIFLLYISLEAPVFWLDLFLIVGEKLISKGEVAIGISWCAFSKENLVAENQCLFWSREYEDA